MVLGRSPYICPYKTVQIMNTNKKEREGLELILEEIKTFQKKEG